PGNLSHCPVADKLAGCGQPVEMDGSPSAAVSRSDEAPSALFAFWSETCNLGPQAISTWICARRVGVHTLLQDLRYAVRQLRKSPGFTLAAVITLAIGIGSNTAIFSSMDAVVLRPLAVPQLDRVVTVAEQRDRGDYGQVALANYQDWARQSRSFEDLAVRKSVDMSLTGAGDAAHVSVALTSANLFTVLRAQPVLGRLFGQSECRPGQDAVAVLNYGFWQRRFGGDPAVLGRKIQLDLR